KYKLLPEWQQLQRFVVENKKREPYASSLCVLNYRVL
ncbi:MAG: hypothetical protein RLY16_410, partial [Bacteroidota bacterium]